MSSLWLRGKKRIRFYSLFLRPALLSKLSRSLFLRTVIIAFHLSGDCASLFSTIFPVFLLPQQIMEPSGILSCMKPILFLHRTIARNLKSGDGKGFRNGTYMSFFLLGPPLASEVGSRRATDERLFWRAGKTSECSAFYGRHPLALSSTGGNRKTHL